jgi:hypothetical protein
MSTISQEEFNKLVDNAIALCKEYDSASPPFFQRSLGIDFYTASLVFEELVKEGVLINIKPDEDEEEINYIGEVDRGKIKDLQTN